jgi:formylglycine-generating enzyme required for sulfatase activity
MKNLLIINLLLLLALGSAGQGISSFKAPKDYVFIPAGSSAVRGQEMAFQAFFMYRQEVTNGQYKQFLADLKKDNDTTALKTARIHTERWLDVGIIDGAAYFDQEEMPIVCISRDAAELFCKWLTKKAREESKEYVTVEFRLPMRDEWEYAAAGARKNAQYPWEGFGVKAKNGTYLAHFKALGQLVGPVKVRTFPPNDFKLFDMSGNVAEMVSDMNLAMGGHWNSLSNEITISWEDPLSVSPMIGFRPVFTFINKR